MVLVLDKRKRPLMPCTEKRARLLLHRGRARVHRMYPFTIRLVDRTVEESRFQPLRLKLDPGSKVTGVALVRKDTHSNQHVLILAEIMHRGHEIRDVLAKRCAFRRRRRGNLRYRPARFENRTRSDGWLAPSLQHRVDTTMAWVDRFSRWAPISSISQELVRFDTQAMQNPEISGIEYQQGTLAGYEVREYLLEKWNRHCAYCPATNIPLQVEHIVPKARGGSNRISNLTLSCEPCNTNKGTRPVEEFLAHDLRRLKHIKAQAKAPLRDAAAVNSTRWALFRRLEETGLQVDFSTGGRTKWNRSRFGIPKTHALDAACVGSLDSLKNWNAPTITIKATGRGSYQRTRLDRYGFPRGYLIRQKQVHGFQTGDMVKADVPAGKKTGLHFGRLAVRASGSFNIQTDRGVVQGISHRHCRITQRADGYAYSVRPKMASHNAEEETARKVT